MRVAFAGLEQQRLSENAVQRGVAIDPGEVGVGIACGVSVVVAPCTLEVS